MPTMTILQVQQQQQHTMSSGHLVSSSNSSISSSDEEQGGSSSPVRVSSAAADEDEMLMDLSSSSAHHHHHDHHNHSNGGGGGSSCSYRDFFYKDASEIQGTYIDTPKAKRRGPRGGVTVPFPVRLYDMLEKDHREDVVSWLPHGRSFMVHQPEVFVSEIMPKFFNQSKLTSFQRQLNLYGFQRQATGRDRGSYYHELFLKGRADLAKIMVRTRVKGCTTSTTSTHNKQHEEEGKTGGGLITSGGTGEPYFYGMPTCSHDNFLRRPKNQPPHVVMNNNNNNTVAALPMTPNSPKAIINSSNSNGACLSPVPSSSTSSSDCNQEKSPCLQAAASAAVATPSPRRVSTLLVPVDQIELQQAPRLPRHLPQQQQQPVPSAAASNMSPRSSCSRSRLSPQHRRRLTAPHLFRQAMQKTSAPPPCMSMMTTTTTCPDVRYLTSRGGRGERADDMFDGHHHQQQQEEWYNNYNIVPESPPLLEQQQQAAACVMSCPTPPRSVIVLPNRSRSYSLSPIPPINSGSISNNWSTNTSTSNHCNSFMPLSQPPPPPFFPLGMSEIPDMNMSEGPFLRHHHHHQNLTHRRVSNNLASSDVECDDADDAAVAADTTCTTSGACGFFEGHEFQIIDDASLEAFESAMHIHV